MIRFVAFGFRVLIGVAYLTCTFGFLILEKVPAPAPAIASLCLGIALIVPPRIKIRGRINPFWITSLKQAITPPVVLSACRWGLGFIYTAAGIGALYQKDYHSGFAIFSLGLVFMSPLDRFFFPILQFSQDKKSGTRSILIVVMRNMGVCFHAIALGLYFEEKPEIANILLTVAFGLLLTATLLTSDSLFAPQLDGVPFDIRTFNKTSSLKIKTLPPELDQPKQPVVQTNDNKPTPSSPPAKAGKKPKKIYYDDAYVVRWELKPSTTEEQFNQWISNFQSNWLAAKEYQQRLQMHRNPEEFKNQIIDELNTYIQEIRERSDMFVKSYDSKGLVTTSCVADHISDVWKSDKRLRSLFMAAKAYSSQSGAKKFYKHAPHIAEYRAMINLVKKIKRTQHKVVKRTTENKKPDNKPQKIEMQVASGISAIIASLLKSTPERSAVSRKSAPGLSDETYFKIIDSIILLGKDMENYKDLTDKMSEERYRDYFLPYLNSVSIEYSAKGEVFNRKGKTDILVFDDQGNNIFVAECKLWRGEAYLLAGIDQLFDNYVKWRDEKAAVIIFNRDVKKFSDVIVTATAALTRHSLYAGGGEQRSDASWSFRFRHPHDDQRLIQLELILFNFA